MSYNYERINHQQGRFVNAFIHSVDQVEMHWHNEMEILLVLEGSIRVRFNNKLYLLEENDLILTNPNEIHSMMNTQEKNIVLAVQVDLQNLNSYYPKVGQRLFNCNSFEHKEDQEQFDLIRYYLAEIVWEINKNKKGHEFAVGSYLSLLIKHLVNHFQCGQIEDENVENINRDMKRLQSIVDYISKSLENRVTLAEIADREQLSVPYLSRFIKEKIGMSYQQYIDTLRMDQAVGLLLATDKTITDIAYESGFPSSKAFYKVFKDQKGSTPTEFREEIKKEFGNSASNLEPKDLEKKPSRTYFDVNRSKGLEKLFSYLDLDKIKVEKSEIEAVTKEVLQIDSKREGSNYTPYWKKLTTFSRAAEGLREDLRLQLKELQKEIKFEYIRFHGIFCDEMMICNMDEKGQITYNWSYVNQLFDFFKKINIKPFIELGFMPSELKSSNETMFFWQANMSRPKDIQQWKDLVIAFVKHCINRYGLEEVETWYFEVWNEPDFEYVFWIGNREDYFKFYKETAQAVKSVSKNLKVGGPAIMQQAASSDSWLQDFLSYCNMSSIHLDFVSLHIYPEVYDEDHGAQSLGEKLGKGASMEEMLEELSKTKRIYHGRNHTQGAIKEGNRIISEMLAYESEVHITEWNASAYNRNLIHDTCFVAPYIIGNVIRSLGEVDILGYWTFIDIQEETKAGISAFHGGFGLMNNDGLKKPSYYAYYLLSKLGEKLIDRGDEHIITKTEDHLQILACNDAYYDSLFLSGDTSALSHTNRYNVFEEMPAKEIEIHLTGLSGTYKMTTYQLNRDHGSVYDRWIEMGAPEDMTKEEIHYLQGVSAPKMEVKYLDIQGDYKKTLLIPPHGSELITLEKQI